ncbi:MAG: copper transporter [Rubrobacteraceae bacterium]
MPDLRYHVISLISVFLALAIGVLLGIAMSDREIITDQLRSEVSGIQKQLDEQQELLGERDEEISNQQRYLEEMSEAMISDSLQGVNVAMIRGPWADEETAQELQNAITSEAGADLTSFVRLPEPTPIEDPPEAAVDPETEYANEAREVLEFEGDAEAPQVVVFIGGGEIPEGVPEGSEESLDAAQRAMFDVLIESGVRVIATEPSVSTTPRSEIPLFQDLGITSVDNVDVEVGQASVVRLANSFEDGSYGTKPTASALFPPSSN